MPTSTIDRRGDDVKAERSFVLERLNGAIVQLQAMFDSQQELVERQRAEIDQLNAKVEQLRDYLDQFYRHLGLQSRPMTPEEIKDIDENGLTSEEFMAEVEKVFGV